MCQVLGVSRSGFYAWLKREESERSRVDRELTGEIRLIHQGSRGTYGSPRIHRQLRRQGIGCGRHRVARLMQKSGIQGRARRRFRIRTTDSNHSYPIAPNRVGRDFTARRPNELWVADITYIPTDEGWLYLASIVDVFSRMVVGWAMESHLKSSLVQSALRMALDRRRPARGLVHHSDQGRQYAAKEFQDLLRAHGLICSMSRRGDCYDNALQESFFHTLKVEHVHHQRFATRREARISIFEYLEVFYNRERMHSALNYLSPAEFEALSQAA